MDSISSYNRNAYTYQQGSMISLPDEDDPKTFASEPSILQQSQELSTHHLSSSASISSTDQVKLQTLDDSHSLPTDLQTSTISNTEDTIIQNWQHLTGTSIFDEHGYQTVSQSDSVNDVSTSYGIHHQSQQQEEQQQQQEFGQTDINYDLNRASPEEISSSIDYETLIRSKQLYFDPNPETIRKPQMISPLVYKQNITIKFLKPPSIPQGPLIIREVRPPQPPPPPPLVIRQRPPPPLSPPPIILREKPPPIPVTMTAQVLTKTLPPLPPPPRSVIIEKLPPLPPKPRDVIIERWIPYEASMLKRKVVVQRAEEAKPYPPPKNIIIEYEKVEARVVRQVERLGVAPEDPETYYARYGSTLLDTTELLAQVKQLGIVEDLSIPQLLDHGTSEKITSTPSERKFPYDSPYSPAAFEHASPRASVAGSYMTEKMLFSDSETDPYAPTYENLVQGSGLSVTFDDLNDDSSGQETIGDELSNQLAQYGLTADAIPY
ncbi:unnamed protein product [Adineta ricciae]|uniref:Uncharacterized protein n=1 Tax=Adineta ricciae TaxID=249248 RepID=A0A815M8I8_ADIRI|nr:unnamed protein product [Adineta ricciae]CAF1417120.1 unnamed protein product [Adineta ricciae]